MAFTYALHDRLAAKQSKVKALVAHPGTAPTSLHGGANPGLLLKLVAWYAAAGRLPPAPRPPARALESRCEERESITTWLLAPGRTGC